MLRRTSPVLRRHVAHFRPVTPVSHSLPRRFYRNPVPPARAAAAAAAQNPIPSSHSFYGEAVATKVDQLVKMAGVRSRRLQLAAGVVGFSLFALWMNKDKITSSVGTQGASVVRETISNKDLQDAAEATVRKMIEQILADESLRGVAGDWVMQLLNSRQGDIGSLMANVIRLDAVQAAAKDLVANLCRDPYIIQQVSSLVVSTIYMQVVQDQAAKWTGELVLRPDVQEKLSQTASDTVRSEAVYDAVQDVAIRVAQGVVNDPATSELLKDRLTEIAADQELQAALSDSAWKVVSRSLNPFAKHPESVNGNGVKSPVGDEDKSQEVIEEPQAKSITEEPVVVAESLDANQEPVEDEAVQALEAIQQMDDEVPVEPVASDATTDAPEPKESQSLPTKVTQEEGEPFKASEEGVALSRASEAQPAADEKEAEILCEPDSVDIAPPSDDIPDEEVMEDIVSDELPELEIAGTSEEADSYGKWQEQMITTGEWLRENYQKYRDRAKVMKEDIMARWRLRRSMLDDDSERFFFSNALRRLSGGKAAADRETNGEELESITEEPVDEEDSIMAQSTMSIDKAGDEMPTDMPKASSTELTLPNGPAGTALQSYETPDVDEGVLHTSEVPVHETAEDVLFGDPVVPTDDSMSSNSFYIEPANDDSVFTVPLVDDKESLPSHMGGVGLPDRSAVAKHLEECQAPADTQEKPSDMMDTLVDQQVVGAVGDIPVDQAEAGAVEDTAVDQAEAGAVEDTAVDQAEAGAVEDTAVDQAEAGAVKDTAVDQAEAGAVKDTTVDQEEAATVKDTTVDQEEAATVKDTTVDQEEAATVKDTTVDQEEAGAVKDTTVDQEEAATVKDTTVDQEEAATVKDTTVDQEEAGAVKDTTVDPTPPPMPAKGSAANVTPSEHVSGDITLTHPGDETEDASAVVSDGPPTSNISSDHTEETGVVNAARENDSLERGTARSGASSNTVVTSRTDEPSASADDQVDAE